MVGDNNSGGQCAVTVARLRWRWLLGRWEEGHVVAVESRVKLGWLLSGETIRSQGWLQAKERVTMTSLAGEGEEGGGEIGSGHLATHVGEERGGRLERGERKEGD